MFELEEVIKEEFLNRNNKKIKDESLNEYLMSFKNVDLARFALTQGFIDEEYQNIFIIKTLKNRPKKYIVDFIINNLEKILESYIKIIGVNGVEQLKVVIKNNKKKFIFGYELLSIHFIDILKYFSLAKVEYNNKDDSLKFFMPEEYIDIFNKCLKDKELLKENKYNDEVFEYSSSVINTYGIITLNKLHEIFESQMFKIDKNELEHIIASVAIYKELYIYNYNDELLLCNLTFDNEDTAIVFYEKQKMNYRKYSKEDYKKISDFSYVNGLKSYKKFVNYLYDNYDGIYMDMDYINEFIIYDFISFAQNSTEDAERVFRTNIVKILEADQKEVDRLLKLMKNIFDEYPKWIKRGNV